MMMEEIRVQLVDYGLKLLESGLTRGTGGNLSQFDPETGLMAITPSGIPYDEMTPKDMVVMALDGTIVEGENIPSSEEGLHRIFYQRRSDIRAIIHTHPMNATVVACLGKDLPPIHYIIGLAGPDVRCAPYATYGTGDLAEKTYLGMVDRKAVLLANHGLVAGGATLAEAYNITDEVEYCAELYIKALSAGKPVILPKEEMERVMERFKGYGQVKDDE